ncbi:Spx/MgsR family RNA polymerase-binding regulatory protein [Idiomarina seosinensis]|uniref:Spx/MgsR family RNA polymerase-binding regulatory protein n=1 Tax=Idiomarina seosinensis TaxID=281739 RepID=UPI00384D7EA0
MINVYGIKNCDTVKKSLAWLDAQQMDYQFRDVRQQPLKTEEVLAWIEQLGTDALINKRSASWRQLTDEQKKATDPTAVAQLIIATPTLFKRPLVEDQYGFHLGFNAATWQQRYV